MKVIQVYWIYADGSVYMLKNNNQWEHTFGCDSHKEEEYHLSEREATRKIKAYCKRLSTPRRELFNPNKCPPHAVFA